MMSISVSGAAPFKGLFREAIPTTVLRRAYQYILDSTHMFVNAAISNDGCVMIGTTEIDPSNPSQITGAAVYKICDTGIEGELQGYWGVSGSCQGVSVYKLGGGGGLISSDMTVTDNAYETPLQVRLCSNNITIGPLKLDSGTYVVRSGHRYNYNTSCTSVDSTPSCTTYIYRDGSQIYSFDGNAKELYSPTTARAYFMHYPDRKRYVVPDEIDEYTPPEPIIETFNHATVASIPVIYDLNYTNLMYRMYMKGKNTTIYFFLESDNPVFMIYVDNTPIQAPNNNQYEAYADLDNGVLYVFDYNTLWMTKI